MPDPGRDEVVTIRNLDKLLRPERVAVVGACDEPGDINFKILQNLMRAGFQGAIHPVNAQASAVQGLPAYASLLALPEQADLALVCGPPAMAPEIVRQCGEAGVGGVVIASGGFREAGSEGLQFGKELRQVAARFPEMRILGPNCLGLVAPHLKLNASFASAMPKPGRVAFVSQSGTLGTSVLDWAIQENVGFSHFVSIGDMLDVSVADLIDYFAGDVNTDAIILYLESLTEARHFMSAARAITKEKPIVAYKAGRFSESARAALSHTGAMSGVDAVYDAAFERAGIVRVFEIDDMFDCAQLLARMPGNMGPRLGIVTNAGGPGVVATDCLIGRNGMLAQPRKETLSQLDQFLPAHWSCGNPIDILADATPDRYRRAIEIVLADPGIDAVLVILTPQVMTDATGTAQVVVDLASRAKKPILAAWMGGRAVREGIYLLNQAGIPTYSTPKNAVHAFAHLVSYARNRETLYETPRDVPISFALDRQTQNEHFKNILARHIDLLSEQDSKQLLEAYGIRTTAPRLATTADQAARLAGEIGYPVVLKVVSPQITHKNEVGGVVLNLGSEQEVRTVFDDIVESVRTRRPGAKIEGVGVQAMVAAPDGLELILGSRKDPVFGPVILVGTGGAAAELLQDFTLGLPPLNERLARRMLESLRTWPILAGQRRRRAANIDQLIETLIRFSYLVAHCPQIGEMDVNPLWVTPGEVVALDARVSIDRDHSPDARAFSHLAIRPYPEEMVKRARLRDRTPIVLRPIRPEDEPLWHDMLAQCSPESIRSRFRSMFREMTHEMAARFCFMDYDRELAIVAEVGAGRARKLVGVGHLFSDGEHRVAEYAILVADPWQGRGVGTMITHRCLQLAAEWGLQQVVGETERLNAGMIATFRRLGFEIDYCADTDLVITRKAIEGT